jgi:receptor protein-tyrosine kinase
MDSLAPAPCSLGHLANAGLIIEDGRRTRLGDEFRICASRLSMALDATAAAGKRNANAVLITSTRPAEGKSFAAINLCAALAGTAARPVILIDADAKLGCLTDRLGLQSQPGLLDLVTDSYLSTLALPIGTPVPGLSVIPIGIPPQPKETLARRRPLTEIVHQLAADLAASTLVFDAGPLLSTSDPSVLAPAVGHIVMVVEAGRTQRPELDAALELLGGDANILLLLNKVVGRQRAAFGLYSYYGKDDAAALAACRPRQAS